MYVEPAGQPSGKPPVLNSAASNFSVGTVLSRSFSTFFKHPFVFIGLGILSQVPVFILVILMLNSVIGLWSVTIIGIALTVLIGALIQGVLSFGIYEVLKGNAAWFGKSISNMIRTLPMVSGAFLTTIFVTLIIMLVLSGITVLEVAEITSDEARILAVSMMIIAVWLLCRWSVIIPVCVVERLGPTGTLRRAAELTKGCFWKIACLHLLYGVIATVFARCVVFVLSLILDASVNELNIFFVEHLARGIPMMFSNIIVAVIYFELRRAKEGASIDSLANVFD